MPNDVGGRPFPNGEEPEGRDRGAAEELAAVVLDEAFVEAARIHEPTAAERILRAALERAESESEPPDPPPPPGGGAGDLFDDVFAEGCPADEGRFDRSDYTRYPLDDTVAAEASRPSGPPARRPTRWQRPVACVLAMVVGLGMIALALTAVQRSGTAQRTDQLPVPPADGTEEGGAEDGDGGVNTGGDG